MTLSHTWSVSARLSFSSCRSDKKADLQKLKELVLLNESLKGQESEFKASCKQQLALLQEQLQAATASKEQDEEEDGHTARMAEIEDLHEKVTSKHAQMRQLLAGWNLKIASKSRLIDDVPTRTELIQYERRFAELYDQVGPQPFNAVAITTALLIWTVIHIRHIHAGIIKA